MNWESSDRWEQDYGKRRNESTVMGAFVIGCLMWVPVVIWALVTK